MAQYDRDFRSDDLDDGRFQTERRYTREGDRRDYRREYEQRHSPGGYDDYGRGYDRDYGRGYYGDYRRGYYGQSSYDQGGYDRDYGRGIYGQGVYGRGGYDQRYGAYRQALGGYGRGYYGQSGYDQGGYDQRYGQGDYEDHDRGEGLGHRIRRGLDRVVGFFSVERRGKAPKSYRRSDERIREDIYDRLIAHDWIDAEDVEIRVVTGEVTLTGFVPDRYTKRAIEDLASEVLGVNDVHNQLRLRREDTAGAAATAPTTSPTRRPS